MTLLLSVLVIHLFPNPLLTPDLGLYPAMFTTGVDTLPEFVIQVGDNGAVVLLQRAQKCASGVKQPADWCVTVLSTRPFKYPFEGIA